jgi:hypothetical protein
MFAAFRGALETQSSNHESTASQLRVHTKRTVARTQPKRAKTQVKRRRRAK